MAPRLGAFIALIAACLAAFVGRTTAAILPQNVLVVYNTASPDGAEVASYYAQVHPEVQLLGLTGVEVNEQISADAYLSTIRPQILAALNPAIDVIVTTKGLPLRIVNTHSNPNPLYPWNKYSSLESELTRIDSIDTWQKMGDQDWRYGGAGHLARNTYYGVDASFDSETYGIRLSCRLDGFTVADVTAGIDRAQRAFVGPYPFVVDNDPDYPASCNTMDELGSGAGSVLALEGVPYTYDNTNTFITEATGPVLGYVSYGVHGGGKTAPNGYLVDGGLAGQLAFDLADGAVFHTHESFNAYSFLAGGNRCGQALVAEWIARGGTVGTGHVEEPTDSVSTVTNENQMFEMLLGGYCWAESAWSATRQLSFVNTIVGDPLMVYRELIPGDANKDGLVGSVDLALLGRYWGARGTPGAMWSQGDFNGDGLVGSIDLAILGNRWGSVADWYSGLGGSVPKPDPFPEFFPIPEPSVLMLIGIGLAGLLPGRNKIDNSQS